VKRSKISSESFGRNREIDSRNDKFWVIRRSASALILDVEQDRFTATSSNGARTVTGVFELVAVNKPRGSLSMGVLSEFTSVLHIMRKRPLETV